MNEKIMIVDDEESIADLVEVYLQNEGYRVCKFYNATDALDCLKQEDLSLVILDVMLPDMDGWLHTLPENQGKTSVSHYHADCQG